jgi:hypothetical protein
MSRTFSTKNGSLESLNVCVRWGFSPNALQIRPMVDWDNPVASAIPRVLQWVAALGLVSRVLVMTSSTSLSLILRGAPGRSWSASPSVRRSRNRLRHLPMVWMVTPSRAATSLLSRPLAQAKTILARWASCWVLLGLVAQVFKTWLSSSARVNTALGRPLGIMSLL